MRSGRLIRISLRRQVGRGEPLSKALGRVDRALTKQGLTGFDPENATQRDQAVTQTLSASLSLLRESERQRFAELAVFPEDAEVPLAALAGFRRTSQKPPFGRQGEWPRIPRPERPSSLSGRAMERVWTKCD